MIRGGIKEFSALSKEYFPQVMEIKTGLLHGVCNGHGLKISAMMHSPCLTVYEWIIRC